MDENHNALNSLCKLLFARLSVIKSHLYGSYLLCKQLWSYYINYKAHTWVEDEACVTLIYQQMAAQHKNGVNSNFIHRKSESFWNFRFSALICHNM